MTEPITAEELAEKALDKYAWIRNFGHPEGPIDFDLLRKGIAETIRAAVRDLTAEVERQNALNHRLMDHLGDKKLALLDGVYEAGYQAGFEKGNPALLAAEDRVARLEAALREARQKIADRKTMWSDLLAEARKQPLANEAVANYLGRAQSAAHALNVIDAVLAAGGAQEEGAGHELHDTA